MPAKLVVGFGWRRPPYRYRFTRIAYVRPNSPQAAARMRLPLYCIITSPAPSVQKVSARLIYHNIVTMVPSNCYQPAIKSPFNSAVYPFFHGNPGFRMIAHSRLDGNRKVTFSILVHQSKQKTMPLKQQAWFILKL